MLSYKCKLTGGKCVLSDRIAGNDIVGIIYNPWENCQCENYDSVPDFDGLILDNDECSNLIEPKFDTDDSHEFMSVSDYLRLHGLDVSYEDYCRISDYAYDFSILHDFPIYKAILRPYISQSREENVYFREIIELAVYLSKLKQGEVPE